MRLMIAFFVAALLPAQDNEISSGPAAGAPLPKASVYAPSGARAGQEYDAAAAIGMAPAMLLFVHEVSRNTAPVIGGLDRLALEFAPLGFRLVSIRLAPDRTQAETESKRHSDALHLHWPIVVSTDGAEGPGEYALNRRCTLTLVVCKGGKVVRSHAFTDTGRQDLPKIRSAIEEVAGKLPEGDVELKRTLIDRLPDDPAQLKALIAELHVEIKQLRQQLERQQNSPPRERPMRGEEPARPASRPMEGDGKKKVR